MSNYPDNIDFRLMPKDKPDYSTPSPEEIDALFERLSHGFANTAKAAIETYRKGYSGYASHFKEALECAFEELIDESKREREDGN